MASNRHQGLTKISARGGNKLTTRAVESTRVENVVGEPGEVTVSLTTSRSSNQKHFRLFLSNLLPVQRRMMQALLVFLFSSCGDAAHVALGSTRQDHGDLGNVVQESALGKIEPPLQLVFPEGVDPPTGKQAH